MLAAICAAVMTMGMTTACSENGDVEGSSNKSNGTDSSLVADTGADNENTGDENVTDDETTGESDITPAMWQVTGENGAVVTFVGSMHALKKNDYPLPSNMMDAFNSSEILAVEADIGKTTSLSFQMSILAAMYYDDPSDRLTNHISDEGYKALDAYLREYSMTAESMNIFQPWAVDNTMENLAVGYSGLSAEYGIDNYFLEQARKNNVEIYEVEGVDFQMDMLMGFSDDIFDLIFRSLEGETKDSQVELLKETYEAWRSGDIDAINDLNEAEGEMSAEDEALIEEYNSIMLYDRNVGMAEAAEKFIDGDKNVFFIVGAAHFVGEKGIISLLENDGYTVERIEY